MSDIDRIGVLDVDYFEKVEKAPKENLSWNIPERKQGIVNVVGGNLNNFRTTIKISEFLENNFPIKKVIAVLPDALKNKLPNLPNLVFLKSTDSGSFLEGDEVARVFDEADYSLLIGDLSKNTTTGRAIVSACENAERPLLITRDSVDLVIENGAEKAMMNENLVFFASLTQLQKLLRAIYYPKMLLLSQSLIQVAEVLHKFTLSYPVKIITLHNEQILVAQNGVVKAVPLENSGYSAFMIWSGELAAKIAALNLYNPNNFILATISSIIE